jgi:acetyltransferase-like isoleucine patch superfamily enzyme
MNIIKTYIANQIIDFLYKTEWWYYKKKNGSKNIKSEFAFIRNLRKKFYARKFRSNKNVEFGDFTYGVPQIYSWGEGTKFKIGKFCSIASGVKILLGGNHRYDWITTYPFISFLAGGGSTVIAKEML